MIAGVVQAQGLTSILERLDTLETRMSRMGSSLEKVQNDGPAVASLDLSSYDTALSEFGVQLAGLQNDLSEQTANLSVSIDPVIEARIAELETQSHELIPLLNEVKAGQDEGFAKLLASLADKPEGTSTNSESAPDHSAPPLPDDLVVTGFVDASFFYDGQTELGSFGLDQVEVDVEKSIGDKGSLRFDVEWASDGEGGFAPDVEQGYLTFNPNFAGDATFSFGKFNAPIGFELLDAPDMYQYSHALVFDNGLPTNLSGAMYNTPIGVWDVAAYVCNGWDTNVDPDQDKTVGGRLGYGGSDWGAIGFSAIHGTETVEDASTTLTVFDIDLAVNPAENWTMGGEFNKGSHDLGPETAEWWGFLVMSHWDFTDTVGGTIRFDYFDDQDGSRLSGAPEVRKAVAVAPTFALGDGMGALLEVRWDWSSENVFSKSTGEPSDSSVVVAFEMTYGF
jgi:hypothetical protein